VWKVSPVLQLITIARASLHKMLEKRRDGIKFGSFLWFKDTITPNITKIMG
jgi:hypothetical protein